MRRYKRVGDDFDLAALKAQVAELAVVETPQRADRLVTVPAIGQPGNRRNEQGDAAPVARAATRARQCDAGIRRTACGGHATLLQIQLSDFESVAYTFVASCLDDKRNVLDASMSQP
jgi:hypothetical protein